MTNSLCTCSHSETWDESHHAYWCPAHPNRADYLARREAVTIDGKVDWTRERQPTTQPQRDPRGIWQGITTPDGLTVQGCEWDGMHVQHEGIVKASYYAGEAGRCPFAALERYRELEQRRVMDQG